MPKIDVVDEEYLRADIKDKINALSIGYQGKEFTRGYMHACYCLGAITKKTLDELKTYLEEKYNKEEK